MQRKGVLKTLPGAFRALQQCHPRYCGLIETRNVNVHKINWNDMTWTAARKRSTHVHHPTKNPSSSSHPLAHSERCGSQIRWRHHWVHPEAWRWNEVQFHENSIEVPHWVKKCHLNLDLVCKYRSYQKHPKTSPNVVLANSQLKTN